MREIKVRGYAVEEMVNSQWIYGTGVHTTQFTKEFAEEIGKSGETFVFTESGGWIEVYPESVGQSTDLKDNNDNKVYEGDIIEGNTFDERINKKQIGKIAYNKDRHGFVFIPYCMEPKNLYYPLFSVVTCAVIGNIFENPDLLKV